MTKVEQGYIVYFLIEISVSLTLISKQMSSGFTVTFVTTAVKPQNMEVVI